LCYCFPVTIPGHKLDGIEAEYDQEIRQALPKGIVVQGVAIPNGANEKRAAGQTVTQDAGAFGANLVVDEYQGLIENLQAKPVVASLGARYMRGLTGDAVFPTNDGGITATWETEIATVAATKNAYGKKTMSPNRLSCTTVVSLQNILQSTPDLERITADDIRMAIERAIDIAAINGTGSGQPEGILNNANVNVLTGATNGIAPNWAQMVDFETKIYEANAEGGALGFLITPGTRAKLKTTAHTANNAYYLMDTNNQINGYNVATSNFVPSNLTKGTGTNLHAAIFGDWSQLLIGEWGFFDMVVDNITQKKSGNIEITVNQFLDVLLRQPTAFAVSKDFII
jgi:HK97 family phage major capsid protein